MPPHLLLSYPIDDHDRHKDHPRIVSFIRSSSYLSSSSRLLVFCHQLPSTRPVLLLRCLSVQV